MLHDAASPRPRLWTTEELALQRSQAVKGFIRWWRETGNVAYRRHYRESLARVEALFVASDDLQAFGPEHLARGQRTAREVARYLAGPPLSEDDLDILAGVERDDDHYALALSDVVTGVLDPMRFPWMTERLFPREPTAAERELALRWTAGLLAAQKAATERRNAASRRQEQAVEAALSAPPLAFTKIPPRTIRSPRDFLAPGEFCRQSSVGGTRADFSIGLRDRLLVVECKVSNSEVNSYKRLNHEVGNKAASWTKAFGEGVIPAAILDGVFKLDNLLKAQRSGITLYWERDLQPLADFVRAAR